MDDEPPSIFLEKCSYCRKTIDLKKWSSAWGENEEQHYKKVDCVECGKENWCKAGFHGSGHDSFTVRNVSGIESIVKKVRGGLHP